LFSEISLFFKEYQERYEKQSIKFNIQVHDNISGSVIRTDDVKLKQILINLIGNAFKFTEKGEIKAGCKLDKNNHLLFYVSDTGIGIPVEKQNLIFERFVQLEQTPNHLYGGTGLRLSIIKGLVGLLGGKIWLESEPAKGTTFYFSFPCEMAVPAYHQLLKPEAPVKYNFSDKTMLIVEDDRYNADYLKEILDGTGVKVVTIT
jgi:signal transduction histidine kinase